MKKDMVEAVREAVNICVALGLHRGMNVRCVVKINVATAQETRHGDTGDGIIRQQTFGN